MLRCASYCAALSMTQPWNDCRHRRLVRVGSLRACLQRCLRQSCRCVDEERIPSRNSVAAYRKATTKEPAGRSPAHTPFADWFSYLVFKFTSTMEASQTGSANTLEDTLCHSQAVGTVCGCFRIGCFTLGTMSTPGLIQGNLCRNSH